MAEQTPQPPTRFPAQAAWAARWDECEQAIDERDYPLAAQLSGEIKKTFRQAMIEVAAVGLSPELRGAYKVYRSQSPFVCQQLHAPGKKERTHDNEQHTAQA